MQIVYTIIGQIGKDKNALLMLSAMLCASCRSPLAKLTKSLLTMAKTFGAKGGKMRAANLSPERRKEITQAATKKRWKNKQALAVLIFSPTSRLNLSTWSLL